MLPPPLRIAAFGLAAGPRPPLRTAGLGPAGGPRLRRLLIPVRGDGTPAITPPLVVLLDGGRPVKALRPLATAEHVEALLDGAAWHGPASLARLRRATGA